MQNLSTQSLLLALGMGAKKTIAASAAINWLLKVRFSCKTWCLHACMRNRKHASLFAGMRAC